jgi:hypothetical protein
VTQRIAERKQKAKECAILWREAEKAVRLAVEASTRESNGGVIVPARKYVNSCWKKSC